MLLCKTTGCVLKERAGKRLTGPCSFGLKICADGLSPAYQNEDDPKVFISYQWDMQSKVDEIRVMLQRNGLSCWADIAMSQRGHSSRSLRSSASFSGQVRCIA